MKHNFRHRVATHCARCINPEWYLELSQEELEPEDCGLCSNCCTLIEEEFDEFLKSL